jgi:AcrR family transcriptional regulator
VALERLSSEDRRRQIAEAALRIVASQGAHRLTAMEIGNAIGVTDAAVFRHYRNKSAIVAAAIGRFEELLDGDAVATSEDPLESLGAFFVRRLVKVRRHPEILRLAFNDRLAEIAGPEGTARIQLVIGRSVAFVGECLREAQRRRLVADDVPVELLTSMVVGCLRSAATGKPTKTAPASPEALWSDLEKLLRRTATLRPRPARKARSS